MSEPRRKTIGPRRPCMCSICNGALKSLTTIRNHRLRDQVQAAQRGAYSTDVKPIVKNEPQEANLTSTTASKESGHRKKLSQSAKVIQVQSPPVASVQSTAIPAAPLPNVPQNSPPMNPDYRTLQVAYLSLQQRCLTLERELYIERSTKGQIIKHLDYLVEVLAPRPPRAFGQQHGGNFQPSG